MAIVKVKQTCPSTTELVTQVVPFIITMKCPNLNPSLKARLFESLSMDGPTGTETYKNVIHLNITMHGIWSIHHHKLTTTKLATTQSEIHTDSHLTSCVASRVNLHQMKAKV